MARAAQPRVPKGTPTKGRVHAGEFASPKGGNRTKAARGRVGAPVPASAPIHQAASGEGGASAADREALEREHQSRLPDEMAGDFKCKGCGWAGWREHAVVNHEGHVHATLAFQGCSRCGLMHISHVGVAGKHSPQHRTRRPEAARPSRTEAPTGRGGIAQQGKSQKPVSKSVDTSETALLRQDLEGGTTDLVGHRKQCPRGGDGPCGKEAKGKCVRCGASVRDHEALGKTSLASTIDVLKQLAGV